MRGKLAALPDGARLPATRALMAEFQASPLTIRAALAALAAEGAIETRPGAGTFRTAPPAAADARGELGWQSLALGPARAETRAVEELIAPLPPGGIALSVGYLSDDLHAGAALARCLARAAGRPGVWDRMPLEGLEALRAWFAHEIGGRFSTSDVLICAGAKPAIAAAFRGLCLAGDAIAMESPTYLGAIATARAAGLRVIPVPTDADGVRPDLLADALSRSGARVFYCQPTYANPTGAVLSAPRRRAVLDAVRRAGAFLIEDDWARDLHFGAAPPPPPLAAADADGHVVYIRSLTKPTAPGLRVAALCARGAALARLRGARSADDLYVAGPLQEAALQFVTSPAWPRHLRMVRAALRARCDALAAALRVHLGPDALRHPPQGGFHAWCALPDGTDAAAVALRCLQHRVVVSAGRDWFPGDVSGPFLRLSFAGAPPEVLTRGVALLAGCLG